MSYKYIAPRKRYIAFTFICYFFSSSSFAAAFSFFFLEMTIITIIMTTITMIISSQMKMQRPRGCGQKWQIGQVLLSVSVGSGTVSVT